MGAKFLGGGWKLGDAMSKIDKGSIKCITLTIKLEVIWIEALQHFLKITLRI